MIVETATLEQAAISLPADDGRNCKGTFASYRLPSDASGGVHVKTLCQEANVNFAQSYAIVNRSAGGIYVFATSDDGGKPESVDQTASRAIANSW